MIIVIAVVAVLQTSRNLLNLVAEWPRAIPGLLALCFGWWLVIRVLSPHWLEGSNYYFGWLIPMLVPILLLLRWRDRPPIEQPGPIGQGLAWATIGISVFGLALVQPVFESNADWRLLPIVAVGCGIGMTLGASFIAGGERWLRHFAFPVAVTAVAVPWPSGFEGWIMGGLMRLNALLGTEALLWLGHGAVCSGNIISLPAGALGVDEACSGIKSLQASMAIALVGGELVRAPVRWRVLLFILGIFVALLGNAVRVVVFGLIASEHGIAAVEKYHDPSGYATMGATLAIVGLAIAALARTLPPLPSPNFPAGARPGGEEVRPTVCYVGVAIAACVLWGGSLLGTQAWYARHEEEKPDREDLWALRPAPPEAAVASVPLPERTLQILLHPDVTLSERWVDGEGLEWHAFYLRWEPGQSAVHTAMTVHDPRNCLAAIGLELKESLGSSSFKSGGFRVPFQRYEFSGRNLVHHVFHAVVRDNVREQFSDEVVDDFSMAGRLRSVVRGKRNRGLSVLEVVVSAPQPIPDLDARVQSFLDARLQSLAAMDSINAQTGSQ